MEDLTEIAYKHIISQLRKENEELRNDVLKLRRMLVKRDRKPPVNIQ